MEFAHKNIRLRPESYRGTRLIFITLCCEAKKSVFADGERAWWLIDCVRKEAQASRFAVHAFCVMPDHFHALVQGLDRSSDLLDFVKTLKQKTAFQHRQRLGEVLWQKKFFDHIVRSQDSWERVAWYIWMNPVRKGLCAHAQDYPFSGSFTMDWKGAGRPSSLWHPVWKGNDRSFKC
jgi:REP element-mobilizing transposase RayT